MIARKALFVALGSLLACAPADTTATSQGPGGKADDLIPEDATLVVDVLLVDGADGAVLDDPWTENDDGQLEFRQQFSEVSPLVFTLSTGNYEVRMAQGALSIDYSVGDADVTASAEMRVPRRNGQVVDPGPDGYTLTLNGGDNASGAWSAHAEVTLLVEEAAAECCKTCGENSQACGNSCIALDAVCSQPAGCACDE